MPRSVDSFVSAERRALEHAARERARAEAQLVELRILREHRAHMATLAEQHARELEAAKREQADRSRRARRWVGTLLGIWLAGFGLASLHPDGEPPSAVGKALAVQIDTCGWSAAQAQERAVLEQRVEHESVLASLPQPNLSEVAPRSPSPPSVTSPRPARVAQPTPPPPPSQCDDASGDPCCAFGRIVC